MKKITLLIITTIVAFTFSACNNQQKSDEMETTSVETTTTTPDDNPSTNDTAKADMNKGIGEAAGKNVIYTCPMHPEVQSDKPGKCPKCGMTLVVKK
jgi:hypothetical protein